VKKGDTSRKTMKHSETRFQNTIMILSFIYAGISLIVFLISIIIIIKQGNVLVFNRLLLSKYPQIGQMLSQLVMLAAILIGIGSGLSTLMSFLSGMALHKATNKHVVHEVKKETKEENAKEIDEDMLTDDEKKIIEILEKNDNVMTQTDLVAESKMTKVKIHRLLKKLETKKILSKFSYGMTNRIRLEKKLKNGEE